MFLSPFLAVQAPKIGAAHTSAPVGCMRGPGLLCGLNPIGRICLWGRIQRGVSAPCMLNSSTEHRPIRLLSFGGKIVGLKLLDY